MVKTVCGKSKQSNRVFKPCKKLLEDHFYYKEIKQRAIDYAKSLDERELIGDDKLVIF